MSKTIHAHSEKTHYSRETREIVMNLRLMDDDFFKLAGSDIDTCQEILRTFLQDEKIIVLEVKTQEQLVGLKREVRLDARCILGNGTLCNIEVQKNHDNDDIRRTRFHNAILTVNNMSDVDHLLTLFTRRDVFYDEKFPHISDRVRYLKENDEGATNVCKAVEEYAEKYAERKCKEVEECADRRAKAAEAKGEARGKEIGKMDALLATARNMKAEDFAIDVIAKVTGLSVEEISEI